jgi:hypothetical protein
MLYAGFASFGLTVGLVVGLSVQEGISGQLLTALFGFVGGSLLTYTGFRRAGKDLTPVPGRVGAGMLSFCLCVIIGLGSGITVREFGGRRFAGAAAATQTAAKREGSDSPKPPGESGGSIFMGLHAGGSKSPCDELKKLEGRNPSPEALVGALEQVGKALCAAP